MMIAPVTGPEVIAGSTRVQGGHRPEDGAQHAQYRRDDQARQDIRESDGRCQSRATPSCGNARSASCRKRPNSPARSPPRRSTLPAERPKPRSSRSWPDSGGRCARDARGCERIGSRRVGRGRSMSGLGCAHLVGLLHGTWGVAHTRRGRGIGRFRYREKALSGPRNSPGTPWQHQGFGTGEQGNDRELPRPAPSIVMPRGGRGPA